MEKEITLSNVLGSNVETVVSDLKKLGATEMKLKITTGELWTVQATLPGDEKELTPPDQAPFADGGSRDLP